MALQDSLGFLDVELTNWLNAQGGPMQLTNDIVGQTDEFGELIRSDAIKLDGGRSLTFKTMLRKSGNVGFVYPYKQRTVSPSQHLVEGTVPWTFYEGRMVIEETEELLNEGRGKLFDLTEVALEGMKTEAASDMEDYWFDPAGNADEQDLEDRPFYGLLAWLTLMGMAAKSSTTSVAGIDVAADARWSSRFACPLGHNLTDDLSMVTGETLTSANDLRKYIKKAARYAAFASPAGLKWAQNDTGGDRGRFNAMRKQKIYANELAYEALEAMQLALAHGVEQVSPREIDLEGPKVGGIPVVWAPKLGFGTTGLPSWLACTTPASRGSLTLTAGTYANTGMVAVVNLKNFKVFGHRKAMPLIKPFMWHDDIQAAVKTVKWFLNTVCTSRMRQTLLWGFSGILPT
jgi:hypothetical protein